jgi:adenylyltransferase/sulfurtransferase
MQASEAVKVILGVGENLVGKLVVFDALANDFYKLNVQKTPDCPHCQLKEFDLDQLELLCQV